MRNLIHIFLLGIIGLSLSACYYDVEEELYPAYASNACDTVDLTYALDIVPILQNACYTCHGIGIGLGNVTLEGFENLQSYIADGSLVGSVEQAAGYSPMPKGGTKLSDCNINKLKIWIQQGASNN